MLRRRARRGMKTLIAARPVAGATRARVRNFRWALALARLGHRMDLDSCLPQALAITLALRPPARLAVGRGAIALAGTPTPPTSGGQLARGATVTGLGAPRPEPPLTAFEQATAAAVRMAGGPAQSLTGQAMVAILQRAHGRHCSRAVKSRGKALTFPRGVCIGAAGWAGGAVRTQLTRCCPVPPRGRTPKHREPKPRSMARSFGSGGSAIMAQHLAVPDTDAGIFHGRCPRKVLRQRADGGCFESRCPRGRRFPARQQICESRAWWRELREANDLLQRTSLHVFRPIHLVLGVVCQGKLV